MNGIKNYAQKPANLILADSVFEYICFKEIKHPNIVMRQAILETGWFKSKFLMNSKKV